MSAEVNKPRGFFGAAAGGGMVGLAEVLREAEGRARLGEVGKVGSSSVPRDFVRYVRGTLVAHSGRVFAWAGSIGVWEAMRASQMRSKMSAYGERAAHTSAFLQEFDSEWCKHVDARPARLGLCAELFTGYVGASLHEAMMRVFADARSVQGIRQAASRVSLTSLSGSYVLALATTTPRLGMALGFHAFLRDRIAPRPATPRDWGKHGARAPAPLAPNLIGSAFAAAGAAYLATYLAAPLHALTAASPAFQTAAEQPLVPALRTVAAATSWKTVKRNFRQYRHTLRLPTTASLLLDGSQAPLRLFVGLCIYDLVWKALK